MMNKFFAIKLFDSSNLIECDKAKLNECMSGNIASTSSNQIIQIITQS
jgi:hypothetical protein